MAKAKKAANAFIDFVTPKKASGALPSAPAALSQAEKEANLKQWMSSGKIRTDEGDPLRLYHVTPKDFDQFKAGGDDPTMSGAATWLTDRADYQPAMHNVGTRQEGVYKEGTNVMPVYSNASRPLLIDDPEMRQWANDVFAGGKNELPYQMSPSTAKAIREAGYDYIHYADPHKSNEPHEYIMLDPERQIKSAIGNRGTYDPNEPSITKAQGGLVDSAPEEAIKNTITDQQAFRMLDMDLANLALMSQQMQPRRMADGGKMSKDEDLFALKPQPKPAVPTVRELVAEIGRNKAQYDAKYPPKSTSSLEQQAYQLMQAAKTTPDANRYLESLNPYFDSQLRFDIGAGSDAGYVKFKEPNIAVMQQLQDVKNTIPHELTHTLQLGKGANVELERDRQVMQRAQALPAAMQQSVLPSKNKFDDMKEVWANINARAHEVNASGGDFINSPEGRALFPTPQAQREYYTKSMPGVNSITPDTGTFVPNNRTLLQRAKKSLGLAEGGGAFNPQGADYDYQTARAYGMGRDGGNWGSVAPASKDERALHGLPDDSYLMLKGAQHPTWGKAVEAEESRGSKIVKHGDRYYSVPSKAEGGEVSQSELDRMRFEIAQQQNPSSPVMQATPRGAIQDFIGTAGGYMDKAGKFVSEAIAPTAEKHPVKHFLANMILADSLKGAGTLMQDLTGTAREADEDSPVRGVISKNFRNLTNSTEPMLDPRALDLAGFATPVVRGVTKLAGAGAKAIAPFATRVDDMVRELSASGAIPQPGLSVKDVTPKALAPANEQGFYSPTEAAALNLQRKTGNGQAFLNDILKGENVKSEEISTMGLDTFLKDKKNVTAAEVQDYIAQNKLGLSEARYGAIKEDPVGIAKRKEIFDSYQPEIDRLLKENDAYIEAGDNESRRKVIDQLTNVRLKRNEEANNAYKIPNAKQTKFGQYQLPDGENYREVVITTPKEGKYRVEPVVAEEGYHVDEPTWKIVDNEGKTYRFGYKDTQSAIKSANELNEKINPSYQSSHFDEPNVLAHLRMSDRVTDGKKTLLVDEVQSDWHQAGREQGYKGGTVEKAKDYKWDSSTQYTLGVKENDPAWVAKDHNGNVIGHYTSEDAAKTQLAETTKGVPNAPYKEDWYQLALRRAVKEAIDGGYDRVALPTGARVNERFSLTKHVDAIRANLNPDGTYQLGVQPIGKSMQKFDESVPADKLANILGKDLANKITSDVKEVGVESGKIFSGLDLKVGGEGNKKYYDEIYPNYLKKFGKKYGAGVGKTTVDVEGAAEPLHYMDITPAMRKEFSTGIHMKRGGKVSFASNIDAMRYELTQRQ